jgi:hypothetical protein
VNAYAILRRCSVEVGYSAETLAVDVLLIHFSFPFSSSPLWNCK